MPGNQWGPECSPARELKILSRPAGFLSPFPHAIGPTVAGAEHAQRARNPSDTGQRGREGERERGREAEERERGGEAERDRGREGERERGREGERERIEGEREREGEKEMEGERGEREA